MCVSSWSVSQLCYYPKRCSCKNWNNCYLSSMKSWENNIFSLSYVLVIYICQNLTRLDVICTTERTRRIQTRNHVSYLWQMKLRSCFFNRIEKCNNRKKITIWTILKLSCCIHQNNVWRRSKKITRVSPRDTVWRLCTTQN